MSSMKICIVGSGWVGAHLTKSLMGEHDVTLYDANCIFHGSSAHNQNRLHLGYHYARDYNTRQLCQTTYFRFIEEYGFLIDDVEKNYYVVPSNNSIIDYKTYTKIFDEFTTHKEVEVDFLQNYSGCIDTQEKYINPVKCKAYFEKLLQNNFIKKEIFEENLESLKSEYDLVINCTNNSLHPITDNIYSEKCDTLLYRRKREINFGALTFVDGKLFSIYPHDFENNIYSLTDVEFTPKDGLTIEEKRSLIEQKVLCYYGDFLEDFEYYGYHIGKKEKIHNLSDCRVPIIRTEDNLISVFTGKIQGIYVIEEMIRNAI